MVGLKSGERGSSSLIFYGDNDSFLSDLNSDGQPCYVHVMTPFISMLPAVVKGCLK